MSLEFDLFSDFFARRDNLLQRMDSRAKLAVALSGVGAVLASSKPVFPGLVFCLSLAGVILLKMPLGMVLRRYLPVMGMALMLLVLHGLMFGTRPLFSVALGSWHLEIYQEGVLRGALVAARVVAAFTVVFLLGSVTPAHELFRALAWFRLPKQWVEIAMMTYRYIFVLLDDVGDIATAQKIRLGYVGGRRSFSSLGVLVGSVLIRSLDQSRRTHEAMTARAYMNELPFAPMPALSVKIICLTLLILAVMLSAYWGCEEGLPT